MTRREMLHLLGVAAAISAAPATLLAATADELAVRAQDLLAAGDSARALAILLEAQAKDARNDRVQALLGRVYYQQGDPRKAVEHFSMAVRLNPEDTLSRMMAETLSQFPLPPKAAGPGGSASHARTSSLAREAEAERRALIGQGGLPRSQGPFRLLIDPGHGGSEPGAAGGGLREADVTLDLALRLARALAPAKADVAVSLTRTADVTLPGWARAGLSGYYGADLLLSLHAASVADPRAAGVAVYSFAVAPGDPLAGETAKAENPPRGRWDSLLGRGGNGLFVAAVRQAAGDGSHRRAATLAAGIANGMPANGPLPIRGAGAGPFGLLAEADAPAVLVEAGFLSHPDDAATLAVADKRQGLAQALATSVLAMIREQAGRPGLG